MKKLILAAVLTMLAGSTAFAQSYDPELGTANIAPAPDGMFAYRSNNRSNAYNAYAQAPGSTTMRSPSRVVGFDGAIKDDPDLNIVFQLHREAQEGW
jgi:hypothetical protein